MQVKTSCYLTDSILTLKSVRRAVSPLIRDAVYVVRRGEDGLSEAWLVLQTPFDVLQACEVNADWLKAREARLTSRERERLRRLLPLDCFCEGELEEIIRYRCGYYIERLIDGRESVRTVPAGVRFGFRDALRLWKQLGEQALALADLPAAALLSVIYSPLFDFSNNRKSVRLSYLWNERDERLVRIWVGSLRRKRLLEDGESGESDLVRFRRARMAEKLWFLDFKRNSSCEVVDVSICQVDQQGGGLWVHCDFVVTDSVGSDVSYDVKHASLSYDEGGFPAFYAKPKSLRASCDKYQLYASKKDWVRGGGPDFEYVFFNLGSVGRHELDEVARLSNDAPVRVVESRGEKEAFPMWLCVPPSPAPDRRAWGAGVHWALLESEDALAEAGEFLRHLTPLFLAAHRRLPQPVLDVLSPAARRFVDLLIEWRGRLGVGSLAPIVLSIFEELLRCLRCGDQFDDKAIARCLYRLPSAVHDPSGKCSCDDAVVQPLGMYDPVWSVASALDTASNLWKHRSEFDFDVALLQQLILGPGSAIVGKLSDGNEVRLSAHCLGSFYEIDSLGRPVPRNDGREVNRISCARYPLIRGVDSECAKCGWLKCISCKYCACVSAPILGRQKRHQHRGRFARLLDQWLSDASGFDLEYTKHVDVDPDNPYGF